MTIKRDRIFTKLSRRDAIRLLMGSGAALALGCGTNDSNSSSDLAASTGGDLTTDAAACAVTPEGEIGPYFADDSDPRFNRSNILANLDGTNAQTGIPLTLTVTILDSEKGCAPYVNAQVDIWHCNS
ncbi:MAG TPA: hypothetical protein VGH63_05020, partial [Polyangia bacterium]